jgi:predicted transcriptional regulator
LINAGLDVKGDTNQYLDIHNYFREHPDDKYTTKGTSTIEYLSKSGLVLICKNNKFRITRRGFYYAIETSGLPAGNFEMIPYDEAKDQAVNILIIICNNKYENMSSIRIDNIKLGVTPQKVILQVIDLMYEEALIEYTKDQEEIQITSKGILKVVEYLLRNR